jgi:galactokinase
MKDEETTMPIHDMPADVAGFINQLSQTGCFFNGRVHIARAPGRMDVMGGIADYSGSLVLEGTLAEAVVCGVARREDDVVRVRSLNALEEDWDEEVTVTLDSLMPGATGDPYEGVRDRLTADPRQRWAAYVAGVFTVLMAEGEIRAFPGGADIMLRSDVPTGAGVSSSAALEVATMIAVCAAFGIRLEGMRLAALCQVVENHIVGAPCGIMDQVTSALGEEYSLLALRCRPHTLEGTIPFPAGIRVVGLDTNVKHSVGGSRYTDTRIGAFMGQKIISEAMKRTGEDTTGGYLCTITPAEFTTRWREVVPPSMTGRDFLDQYGGTNDTVTTIDPDEHYMIRSRTEHPIYENHRTQRFRGYLESALESGEEEAVHREMIRAGKLMFGSNWSYGHRCGQGSRETDLVVRMVRDIGPTHGFYGAKITGGGSGGTVAILCRDDTDDAIRDLSERYAEVTRKSPRLFFHSGPGAVAFGTREVDVV